MQISQLNIPKGVIDLGVGQPSFSLLPVEMMRRAAEHRLHRTDSAILNYGLEPGNEFFRDALARFLTQGYGVPVERGDLFVTAGGSQGLDLLCTLLTRSGDTIFVEEPTYFLALLIFRDHGLNVVSIPTDHEGLRIEKLEEELQKHQPVFLYTIPTFHNPSSMTLVQKRRQHLASLAEEHDFQVIADEVYHLLAYTQTPPPPMRHFDQAERVLSLGSFSKILAPGLRLGWIQAAPGMIDRIANAGLLISGGGLNPFTSSLVQGVLELGWQNDHLDHLKETYQRRSTCLSMALREKLPERVTFADPGGGFFIWLRLSEDVNADQIRPKARLQGMDFQPGRKFSSRDGLLNFVRLSFSFYEEEDLREGIRRLARVLTP
jgi:DNA-binding transcriptional MocR family regulator